MKTQDINLSADQSNQPETKHKKRQPRKISAQYLRNAALFYLQRFSSSSENLRNVLMRKVRRSALVHDTDLEECAIWVDDIIQRYQETGLLDDAAYAQAKARALRDRGNSNKSIRMKLMSKGIPAMAVDEALNVVADRDGSAEMDAAVSFARRRKIGPFGPPETREERRGKGLAAMARAGFTYDMALKIIDAESDEPFIAQIQRTGI